MEQKILCQGYLKKRKELTQKIPENVLTNNTGQRTVSFSDSETEDRSKDTVATGVFIPVISFGAKNNLEIASDLLTLFLLLLSHWVETYKTSVIVTAQLNLNMSWSLT